HKEYLEMLEKEITKAFVYSYQEQAEALFQNYLDHAEAFVNKTRVKDRNTKKELQPDEGFLKSIEEQIAIIGSAAEGFRQEVIAYLWASSRRGERVSYRSYEPLKEAIEKKLMTSVRDISRIITKARTRDEEQGEKYGAMVKNLLENGYCPSCVDVVLKYAANNLWKDRGPAPAPGTGTFFAPTGSWSCSSCEAKKEPVPYERKSSQSRHDLSPLPPLRRRA